MAAANDAAQSLFLNALDIDSEGERAAYLQAQCGADAELRREVEDLLGHAQRLGSFLEPGEATDDASTSAIAEQPGAAIGPYRLLQQIGEGGMGVVFMAEQSQPVRRTVAFKIIKPGMDSRQVIARFEAERQALALMDHPNIAKVFEAGTTPGGRPYFVMELVKGVPITKYCDQQQLTIRQRLELMVAVCQAIQHAHQKGVIHRDVKPTNVLVAEYDGLPAPKVIDFGVAKATAQKLTERTMFTEYGQLIGTFEYMSPEQARFNQLDVDTRSDIYSLGVLLYELLAGSTPVERRRLETEAFDETLRIIREEEPPRPSARISATQALSTIAVNRQVEATRLSRTVRGELDWIVMKALEKDRNRRYETASALAADVVRYLNDQPVSVGPPSRLYRASKFVRRNKLTVIATAAVLAGLIAGTVGAAIGLVSQSRQRAEAQLNLAHSLQSQRKYAEAEALYRNGLASASGATAESRQRAARTRLGLAKVVYDRGDPAASERLHREALGAYRASFPPGDPNIAHALTTFALLLRAHHRYAEAEPLFREAYQIYRSAVPSDPFAVGVSATYLASVLIPLGKHGEAEPILREGIAAHQRAVPPDEWALAVTRLELGRNLASTGRFAEAEVELVAAQRSLASTEDYQRGLFVLTALYAAWDQAEPGNGYELKSREWLRRLVETFVRLDESPGDARDPALPRAP